MIGKVLKLHNGLDYCVLEELVNENKKYIMAFQVDNEKDISTNNFIICEVKSDLNQSYTLYDIDDEYEFEKVAQLFIKKLENKKI